MTREESVKLFNERMREALEDLTNDLGEDNVNFIGSLIAFDDDGKVSDESTYWIIGDLNTCLMNGESLLEEVIVDIEMNDLFNYNAN